MEEVCLCYMSDMAVFGVLHVIDSVARVRQSLRGELATSET
jgi:hypothetical protein